MISVRPNSVFIDEEIWAPRFNDIEDFVKNIELSHPEVFNDPANVYIEIQWFHTPGTANIPFDLVFHGDIPKHIQSEAGGHNPG
jgi:hypothetical protein